ncbi:MAG: DUF6174 domain-containing protein [Pirellulales bacterium]|nr:DUF6174 domain-containing protein [Pirellulales bacterium]
MQSTNDPDNSRITPPSRVTISQRWRFWALILVCGVAGALFTGWMLRPPRLPELTRAQLNQARQLWETRNPAAYTLELTVTGTQAGEYQTRVAGGKPVSVTRNGQELRRHTWEYWTVGGLLRVIDDELSAFAPPAVPPPHNADKDLDQPAANIVMRATFDPQWGFPAQYQRTDWSTGREIQWRVTKFAVDPP